MNIDKILEDRLYELNKGDLIRDFDEQMKMLQIK